jgi:hypothetical protein
MVDVSDDAEISYITHISKKAGTVYLKPASHSSQ